MKHKQRMMIFLLGYMTFFMAATFGIGWLFLGVIAFMVIDIIFEVA